MSDYVDMTNEEIWKMLESKMRKNGLKSVASITHVSTDSDPFDINSYNFTPVYAEDDVANEIALAYKVGYLRAMKGRPFKIGEKKKKGGHWELVDIKDVLKGECKIVEDCLGWHYEYLGTYKKGEDSRFYQWVEDNE